MVAVFVSYIRRFYPERFRGERLCGVVDVAASFYRALRETVPSACLGPAFLFGCDWFYRRR